MMLSRHLYCTIIFFLLSIHYGIAQVNFEPLQTNISFYFVRDIYRDDKGFLWVGNDYIGLLKNNSYSTVAYKNDPNDSTSLSNDFVGDIEQDSSKALWIATNNGLNRYLPEIDGFKRYFHHPSQPNSLSSNSINRLFIDKRKNLWVLTSNGLCSYSHTTDNFTRYNTTPNSPHNDFLDMVEDKNGDFWIVTKGAGIFHLSAKTNDFTFFKDNNCSQKHTGYKKIIIDSSGQIWIGNRGLGVANFSPKHKKFEYLPVGQPQNSLPKPMVTDIIEWKNNTLLIGIDQGGLNVYNKNTGKITLLSPDKHFSGLLASEGILCLYQDKEGILWIGTSRAGISFYNPQKIKFNKFQKVTTCKEDSKQKIRYPTYNTIGSFFEDKKNQIWVGTDGGGVNILDKTTKTFKVLERTPLHTNTLSSNVIRTITKDNDHRFYICTWNGGINIYNPQNNRFEIFRQYKPPFKNYKYLWSMHIDSRQRLWTSISFGVVSLYDKNRIKIKDYVLDSLIRGTHIPLFFENKKGELFTNLATGIFKYHEKEDTFKLLVEVSSPIYINLESPHKIWIGTIYKGLYLCSNEGKILKNFTQKDGLCSNNISAILMENKDELWISTKNGLSYFDVKNEVFFNYSKKDGLPSMDFFDQSALKTSDGEMYFGTNNGFISFYPEKIKKNLIIPPVYVNQFFLNKTPTDHTSKNTPLTQPIQQTKKIVLKHNQSSFGFGFVAINFTYPNQNRYQYILEGFDKNWIETSAAFRKATYTNIPSGTYFFKVKGSNNDGVWNETPAVIEIEIKPLIWEQLWFIITSIICTFLLILFIIRIRNIQLKKQNLLLQKEVKERTKLLELQRVEVDQQNVMLEEQKEELEVQTYELIDHRKRLEVLVDKRSHSLKMAIEKAEQSDKLKSYFLSNFSHEIRTPMNAIVGFTSLLKRQELLPEQQREFISLIRSNSNSLLYLIEDIMDYSMIESNQLKITKQPFDLNLFLDDSFRSYTLGHSFPNIQLKLNNQIKALNLIINSDAHRIRQILINLLNNAIKFTKHGTVELLARLKNKHLIFEVIDTGPGISKKNKEIIFKQFVKIDTTQQKSGIGLGLAISKQLATLLGGRLTLFSELGKGSTFSFILPLGYENKH